jgi:hypothetical protein
MRAIIPYAGDNVGKYRPQESPANAHINDDAGDAVGILLDVIILHHSGDNVRIGGTRLQRMASFG